MRAKEIQRPMAARRAALGSCGSSNDIAPEYTVAFRAAVPYNRGPIDAPDGASSVRQEVRLSLVTSKKASVEGTRSTRATRADRARRSAVATSRPRPRGHTLAPEHIGEAGSAAVLTMAILGLSTFIAAIALIVFGLTTAGSYGASPPPNAGSLGMGQVLGGFGLLVIGLALVGSSLAVLADLRGSRRGAAVGGRRHRPAVGGGRGDGHADRHRGRRAGRRAGSLCCAVRRLGLHPGSPRPLIAAPRS